MSDPRHGQVRVLLVDDHPIVRTGLRFVLEQDGRLRVIGEASGGKEAIRMAADLKPDVILMDINLPDISGLEATRQIKVESPATRVLVVSLYKESEYVLGMLEAGADGYLVKHCEPAELRGSVLRAHGGERVLHQSVLHAVITKAVTGTTGITAEGLSEREREVLQLLAEGRSNKEVAALLDVGLSTVETHRANLMQKLNLHNTAEIVLYAVRKGIIHSQT